MALPDSWADKLFRKLSATYGQAFLRQYDGVPMDDVKANWAHELGCFEANPTAIARGLELLPADRAPTVLQFRELCKTYAQSEALALPAPTEPADPAVIAAARKALKPITNTGSKEWANVLKKRHELGDRLTRFQIQCYRTALGIVPQPAGEAA